MTNLVHTKISNAWSVVRDPDVLGYQVAVLRGQVPPAEAQEFVMDHLQVGDDEAGSFFTPHALEVVQDLLDTGALLPAPE